MVRKLGVLAAIFVSCVPGVHAEQLVVELKNGADPTEITVDASQSAVDQIIAYDFSNGNDPLNGVVSIQGPAGMSAKLEMRAVTKTAGAEVATADSGWGAVDLVVNGKTRKALNISAPPVSSFGVSTGAQRDFELPGIGDLCAQLSARQYDEIAQQHRQLCPNDQPLDRPGLCQFLLRGGACLFQTIPTPSPTGEPGTGGEGPTGANAATFTLLKDVCNKKVKRYAVRLVMNLANVDPATRAAGFTVSIQFAARLYQGKRAASIKPTSEGKFAPQPLLLMQSISGYGAFFGSPEEITLVRFRGGKVRSQTSIDVEDYVPYRDLFLTRSLIGKQLRGGKGVFVLSNGSASYGLCLPLARRRSYAGDYQ